MEEALKAHPGRAIRLSPEEHERIWKRKRAIVRWRLVRGWGYERIAKKFGVSVGYAQMLVSQYRKWERGQKESGR